MQSISLLRTFDLSSSSECYEFKNCENTNDVEGTRQLLFAQWSDVLSLFVHFSPKKSPKTLSNGFWKSKENRLSESCSNSFE